jgi:hypothetical protein
LAEHKRSTESNRSFFDSFSSAERGFSAESWLPARGECLRWCQAVGSATGRFRKAARLVEIAGKSPIIAH